ncbi:MAG: hypothetical protein H6741_14565 [Alphaproteobacteria bacterium]|nr:hypothetical protein [Alphaproteobacteria bacterium]
MTRLLSITLAAALTLGAVTLPATAALATESGISVTEAQDAYDMLDAFAGALSPEAEDEAQAVANEIVDATWANHGSLEPLEIAVEDAALRALAGEDLNLVLDDFSHATPELDQALRVYSPGEDPIGDWFDASLPRWLGRILTILIILILI